MSQLLVLVFLRIVVTERDLSLIWRTISKKENGFGDVTATMWLVLFNC
jgi:hypothetical protein